MPDLRTYEIIAKQMKTTYWGGLNFCQGDSCNSRVDFMRDLLLFGKDIKVFLQIYNKYLTSQIGLCSLLYTGSILLSLISNFSIFAFVDSV